MSFTELSNWNDIAITLCGIAAIILFYVVGKKADAERRREAQEKEKQKQ